MSEQRQPWERMPAEPIRWFARFCRYRDLGPTRRSVLAAYVAERRETTGECGTPRPRPMRTPKTWNAAAVQWNWQRRAEDWDAAERRRTDAADRDWRDQRRQTLLDAEWRDAAALRAEAQRLLSDVAGWPAGKTREMGEDVRERTTGVEIVKLTIERDLSAVLVQAAALFDRASVLGRRSVGLAPIERDQRADEPAAATSADDSEISTNRLIAELAGRGVALDSLPDTALTAIANASNNSPEFRATTHLRPVRVDATILP